MIRKTAMLTGIAGALMFAAPALAQEAPQDTAAPAAQESAQPQSLTLTPGATVKSADGTELGKLVGVQNGASGQELTVRGVDGSVRPVSLAGIKQQGSDIVVDATASDFQSATPIETAEPAPMAEPTPADQSTDADEQVDEPTEEPRV
ncbi:MULTISPECIES: superoxide dismutase [unclassified Brevundimonas]|uniref:superoxide dismutase n=1 Tax=unclassified Brevundimonas TaxID=2622653 RepID=UPI0025B964BF|nr:MULTISPECIES: superoxide dismutase [unclassified Brevundimonas]